MLELRNLVVGYSEPLTKALNLQFERGSAIAFFGPNGVGKTTLLKTLSTLLEPLEGYVLLNGEAAEKRRQRIFYLTELIDVPLRVTAKQYVDAVSGFYPDSIDSLEALRLAGVPPNVKLGKLSMGMRRRAQLAAALAVAPYVELMCLDDPFVGVDAQSSSRILEHFKRDNYVLVVASRTPVEGLENIDFSTLKPEE
ncbi:ATP-binding cassette domain-containing protein [Thermofilum pendens]|uniref:ABC transporter related n=1 Tax=Thermofilum pendens (strain DSM 2475 / Hrk 5) TaxID=368408 RepID=A1RZU5_THEPD|nr:ATP-binding cassette domain-containing protein [Thermofilum pendens]ABL78725.1 ABC transporter related [Thermofilum pendens Hrk 5]